MRLRMLAIGVAGLMISLAAPVVAQPSDPGRIVGRLTKSDGQPVADAGVTAVSLDGSLRYHGRTQADGSYVLPEVWPDMAGDQFKIQFWPPDFRPTQWAYQKRTEAEADAVRVVAGQDTVVNDTLLPTGTVEFTASNAVTGAPISKFCGAVSGAIGKSGCTDNGTVTLAEVPPGEYDTSVYSFPDYFTESSRISVQANQVTKVHSKLAPTAKIAVTVVDAKTKAPVPNACLHAKSGIGGLGDFFAYCTGADGQAELSSLITGSYTLWVEARDGVHGSQWVGVHGGTGSRSLAKTVNAVAGQTTTVSPILLDGTGSITGTVVDSTTGAPVAGVCAFPRAGQPYDGSPDRSNCTKQDGKYTIAGLGPYHWPVNFIDHVGSYAWQWSGDQPSQATARPVKVLAGQSTTENARLTQGTTISGKVIGGGSSELVVYNAITGDLAGSYGYPGQNGVYQLKNIAGNQLVKVKYSGDDERWYRNATTFASARPILVRAGTPVTGIDFTVTPR